jgi:hypothetical protein
MHTSRNDADGVWIENTAARQDKPQSFCVPGGRIFRKSGQEVKVQEKGL